MSRRPTTKLAFLLAFVLLALAGATQASQRHGHAQARPITTATPVGPAPALFPHRMPFAQMTLAQLERHQENALQHYRYVSRFFLKWRKTNLRLLSSARSVPASRCKATGVREPWNYCWYAAASRWTARELAKTRARAVAAALAAAWPAHHALWLCIHAGEGAWDDPNSGGNGHYGGLQMHPGWGYGTSYYANEDSQLVQEQSAERGYRASGYSRAWLNGQWGQTIGPCWQYAD